MKGPLTVKTGVSRPGRDTGTGFLPRPSFVERFIGTLRAELLNHVIIMSKKQLDRLLGEFINSYYRIARPHQGVGGRCLVKRERPGIPIPLHKLVAKSVCGGLHHVYRKAA